MWPKYLDLKEEECLGILRKLEMVAYSSVVSALRAQGDLTKERRKVLHELSVVLNVSIDRHKAEIRRAVNDETLSTVSARISGANSGSEWAREGRRIIPLLRRGTPITRFTGAATKAKADLEGHNKKLLPPSKTTTAPLPAAAATTKKGRRSSAAASKAASAGLAPPSLDDILIKTKDEEGNSRLCVMPPSISVPAAPPAYKAYQDFYGGDVVVLPSGMAIRVINEEADENKSKAAAASAALAISTPPTAATATTAASRRKRKASDAAAAAAEASAAAKVSFEILHRQKPNFPPPPHPLTGPPPILHNFKVPPPPAQAATSSSAAAVSNPHFLPPNQMPIYAPPPPSASSKGGRGGKAGQAMHRMPPPHSLAPPTLPHPHQLLPAQQRHQMPPASAQQHFPMPTTSSSAQPTLPQPPPPVAVGKSRRAPAGKVKKVKAEKIPRKMIQQQWQQQAPKQQAQQQRPQQQQPQQPRPLVTNPAQVKAAAAAPKTTPTAAAANMATATTPIAAATSSSGELLTKKKPMSLQQQKLEPEDLSGKTASAAATMAAAASSSATVTATKHPHIIRQPGVPKKQQQQQQHQQQNIVENVLSNSNGALKIVPSPSAAAAAASHHLQPNQRLTTPIKLKEVSPATAAPAQASTAVTTGATTTATSSVAAAVTGQPQLATLTAAATAMHAAPGMKVIPAGARILPKPGGTLTGMAAAAASLGGVSFAPVTSGGLAPPGTPIYMVAATSAAGPNLVRVAKASPSVSMPGVSMPGPAATGLVSAASVGGGPQRVVTLNAAAIRSPGVVTFSAGPISGSSTAAGATIRGSIPAGQLSTRTLQPRAGLAATATSLGPVAAASVGVATTRGLTPNKPSVIVVQRGGTPKSTFLGKELSHKIMAATSKPTVMNATGSLSLGSGGGLTAAAGASGGGGKPLVVVTKPTATPLIHSASGAICSPASLAGGTSLSSISLPGLTAGGGIGGVGKAAGGNNGNVIVLDISREQLQAATAAAAASGPGSGGGNSMLSDILQATGILPENEQTTRNTDKDKSKAGVSQSQAPQVFQAQQPLFVPVSSSASSASSALTSSSSTPTILTSLASPLSTAAVTPPLASEMSTISSVAEGLVFDSRPNKSQPVIVERASDSCIVDPSLVGTSCLSAAVSGATATAAGQQPLDIVSAAFADADLDPNHLSIQEDQESRRNPDNIQRKVQIPATGIEIDVTRGGTSTGTADEAVPSTGTSIQDFTSLIASAAAAESGPSSAAAATSSTTSGDANVMQNSSGGAAADAVTAAAAAAALSLAPEPSSNVEEVGDEIVGELDV